MREHLKKKYDALAPVVSAVLALAIVISIVGSVLLVSIPYINQINRITTEENANRQFLSTLETINDLANANPGDTSINQITGEGGSIYVDKSECAVDRTIISYSYNNAYNFTISGLNSCSSETCFLAGTKVLMADGSHKNIEEVEVGDLVLSFDEHTRATIPSKVSMVFYHEPEEMNEYYLLLNNGLKVTPNHRFYSNNKWVAANDLQIGDPLFSSKQTDYFISSIKKVNAKQASFDLEIEQSHTYFVFINNDVNVLVHNASYVGEYLVNLSATADSFIREQLLYRNVVYGDQPTLRVDSQSTQGEWTLIRFDDLLLIPIGSTIHSATLKLYYWSWENHQPTGCTYDCRKIYGSWDELIVTWNNKPSFDNINIAGSGTVPSLNNWMNFSLTTPVQHYVNRDIGYMTYFGWLIKDHDTTPLSYRAVFRSRDATNPSLRPILQIDYTPLAPDCETHDATSVEVTNATLNGEITEDYDESCNYRFEYDTDGFPYSYRTSWSTETVNEGQPFAHQFNNGDLFHGTRYYFRALAKNGANLIGYGLGKSFLTKPASITDFFAETAAPDKINLSWTNHDGGAGAYIEYLTGPTPSIWNPGVGTPVNGIGYAPGTSCQHTGLTPGTHYIYKAWAYAEDEGWKSKVNNATAPLGDNSQPNSGTNTTKTIPTVTTDGYSDVLVSVATINGTLQNLYPASSYSSCTVWFQYGVTLNYEYDTSDRAQVLSNSGPFSVDLSGLQPGTVYYFRAVGMVDGYVFYASNHNSFETIVEGIRVDSPKEDYKWQRGTTQKIEWMYGPDVLPGSTVKIILCYEDQEQQIPNADSISIDAGEFHWNIPIDQMLGDKKYRISITVNEDNAIYDLSGNFSIVELHKEIFDNVTIDRSSNHVTPASSPAIIVLPSETYNNRTIEPGESFTLIMIDGELTRAEIYWFIYYEGEPDQPLKLKGAVCIDLYNDDDNLLASNSYCFGSIWILDSDSIEYASTNGGELQKIIMENGGVVHVDVAGESLVKQNPPYVYEKENIFQIHVIQLVAAAFSGGGSGGFHFRIYGALYLNTVREARDVYNLRLQLYGDNSKAWVKYFKDNFEFINESVVDDNTLFYTPSSSMVYFAFSHSAIEIRFQ